MQESSFWNHVQTHGAPNSPANIKVELIKVKLPLCLTKHHATKTYWGVQV
jgi:hypothetical protein